MISNAQIRARARAVLGNNIFSSEWLYAIIIVLAVSALNAALGATVIGTLIVYGLLMCATAAYFSGRVRNTNDYKNLGVTIDAVKTEPVENIICGLLYSVFIALWTMLFIVPGIVKSCSYAMTFYVKNDNPGMSANDAITESRRLMDGYKMQYFLLQLSFIGWMIVGTLCLGVGTLWVSAYMETARATFYEEVKAAKSATFTTYNQDPNAERKTY